MQKKKTVILMFTLLALPIPFSMFTWIGTIISVANIGMLKAENASTIVTTVVALGSMLLAGSYPASYGASLILTLEKKRLTFISYLPILHILLTGLFFLFWSLCE